MTVVSAFISQSDNWKRPRNCVSALHLQYLTGKQFFRMSFVSYGTTLAKHMVKQGEVIFFPSDKKLELNYFIDN